MHLICVYYDGIPDKEMYDLSRESCGLLRIVSRIRMPII